jgi:ATP-dependent protease Clp ATPase subunit
MDVRGSLVSQYVALFGHSGVELRFTAASLREICRQAIETGGGARGLRNIMVSPPSEATATDHLCRRACFWMPCMTLRMSLVH